MVIVTILFFVIQVSYSQDQVLADSALKVLNSGISISDKEKLKLYRTISGNSTSPGQVISYSGKLIESAWELDRLNLVFQGYRNLGYAYTRSGDLDKAIETYYQLMRIADSVGNDLIAGEAMSNMATTYKSNKDYTKARLLEFEAIQYFKAAGDSLRMAAQYLNLGNTYYYLDRFDSAMLMLSAAMAHSDNKYLIPYTNGTAALVLAKLGENDTAEYLLNRALKSWEDTRDHYAMADTKVQFGGICFEQGRTREAIDYLLDGYRIARENGLKEQIQDGARILSEIYMRQEDYPTALQYQTEYYTYRDSLINAESIKKMADQRIDYEVGLKQAEVDLLEARQENQRIILMGLAIFLFVVVVVLIIIYRFYTTKNRLSKELATQKDQLERLNHTKDKFFSIISHDLRSPVSAFLGVSRMIRMLVKSNKTKELMEMTDDIDESVQRLSSLLDNLLNWAVQQQGHFPNVPEKVNVKELLDNMMVSFSYMAKGKHLSLSNSIDEPVYLWADKNSTATIFRNLINNALKFTGDGGSIEISSIIREGMAHISISDTGVGIPQEKLEALFQLQAKKSTYGTKGEKGLGLGLQLVNEFIIMNNGRIAIDSEEGKGTTFTVSLPLFSKEFATVPAEA